MSMGNENLDTVNDNITQMTDVLDHLGDLGDSKVVSKLAKVATALSALSLGLTVFSAIFGGKSREEELLEQAIGLLKDLKKQIAGLQEDVNEGFKRVINKVTILSAKEQVFKDINYIAEFNDAVREYLDYLKRRADAEQETTHYEKVVMEFKIDHLRVAVRSIQEACGGTSSVATSILDAAIHDSHVDFTVVKSLGKHLFAAAVAAAFCEGVYWRVKHKGHEKDLKAARKDIEKTYGEPLEAIGKAVHERLLKCSKWEMVALNHAAKIDEVIGELQSNPASLPWPDSGTAKFKENFLALQEEIAKRVYDKLTAAYPRCLVVVAVNPGYETEWGYFTGFTFRAHGIGGERCDRRLHFKDRWPETYFRITAFLMPHYDDPTSDPPISEEAHYAILHETNIRQLHKVAEDTELKISYQSYGKTRPYCRVTYKAEVEGVMEPPVVKYSQFFTHAPLLYDNPHGHDTYKKLASVVVYASDSALKSS
jgi:hypothetical protein